MRLSETSLSITERRVVLDIRFRHVELSPATSYHGFLGGKVWREISGAKKKFATLANKCCSEPADFRFSSDFSIS